MSDPLQAWRAHAGGTAWPTVALAAVALGGWTSAVLGHALGHLPLVGAAALATGAAYLSFTPLHEATHGNVGGRRRPWLDEVVGWLAGLPLLAPWPAFRALHLRHHARTNDPVADPDMWVAASGARLVGRCLTILPHYYRVFLGPLSATSGSAARSRPVAVGFLVALVTALGGAAWAGYGATVLGVVVAPAWLAIGLLALLFDWLPHHPHTRTGRFVDTRAIPGRALEVLLLGQSLHLVHHLWPSVPWYRYGAVFEVARPELEARGSEIVGLGGLFGRDTGRAGWQDGAPLEEVP